jgi:mRNA interferase RelE/StbE
VSQFKIYVTKAASKELKTLPGQMRQRVRKAVEGLADDPRPPKSKKLEVEGLVVEVRRLRMDRWRILYAITQAEEIIDVLAVRKRPPYDYGDLEEMLSGFPRKD